MPIVLCESGTASGVTSDQPASWQLADLFSAWIPSEVEAHLRSLNQTWPLAGLYAQVARGEVTKGQWVLYVACCLQGQILNGGVEGFAFNCPGLLLDARLVTREFGSQALADMCDAALSPALAVVERHGSQGLWATGDDLTEFWNDFEAVEIDGDLAEKLERAFYDVDDQPNPISEDFAARVVALALANAQDFCA